MITFQNLILKLQTFWQEQGCILGQPYDLEMGAGTSHPLTALKSLSDDPWKVAFVQPCRRPGDGRYGENPNRFQRFYQFQVFLKPSPADAQSLLLQSYAALGLSLLKNEIRFLEDDWANPSLGASGRGWEVWCNGMEITQFTYFQQMGGMECQSVGVELAYGLERLCMVLQEKDTVLEIVWHDGPPVVTYGDLVLQAEKEFCSWYFEEAPVKVMEKDFEEKLAQSQAMIDKKLSMPAYDLCIQANHIFNMLEARGAMATAQRAHSIARIRMVASQCCKNLFPLSQEVSHG